MGAYLDEWRSRESTLRIAAKTAPSRRGHRHGAHAFRRPARRLLGAAASFPATQGWLPLRRSSGRSRWRAPRCPSPRESVFADGERLAFDAQMRFLREYFPRPIADDIVLIGTDEETERIFTEPIALWHRHFARAFHALAKAGPAAVGVDVVLPERSFDAIIPGHRSRADDRPLQPQALHGARLRADREQRGRARAGAGELPQHHPPENLGIDQQLKDPGLDLAALQRARARGLGHGAHARGPDPARPESPGAGGLHRLQRRPSARAPHPDATGPRMARRGRRGAAQGGVRRPHRADGRTRRQHRPLGACR